MTASVPGARRRVAPILLYLVFVAGWAFASVLVVRTVLMRDHTDAEVTVAWFFAAGTGVLIAAMIDRDYRGRRDAANLLEETQRVIDSVAVVTEPRLSELGFDELLIGLLERIRRVLDADATAVFLLEGDPPHLVLAAAPETPELVGLRVTPGTGVCSAAAESGTVQVVRDVRTVADAVPGVETRSRSLVAAPLTADGRLIGVMEVGGIQSRDFGVYDLQLIHLVADRAAAAIERGRLDEAARRSREGEERARRQLALLADAGEVLGESAGTVAELLVRIPRLVAADFADHCTVHRVARDGVESLGASSSSTLEGEPGGWRAAAAHVVGTGRRRVWRPDDAGDGPPLPGAEANGLSSVVVVPVEVAGRPVAAVTVGTAAGRRPLGDDDLGLLDELAARVSVAAERVLLQNETRQAADRESRRASQLNRLVGSAVAVNSVLPAEAVARLAAEQARYVLDADQAVLELVDGDGPPRVHSSGDLLVLAGGAEPHAVAAGLVGTSGTSVGRLTVRRASGPFAPEDEAILGSLAQVASLALANGTLYENLSRNESRLRAMYDAAPFAIVELDHDGTPVRWNQTAVALFSWPEVPEPGRVGEFPLEPAEQAAGLVATALGGEPVLNVELQLRDSDPAVVVELAVVPLGDQSAPGGRGALVIAIDTSERRRVAEQLQQAQRMEAMGRLAGGVAHDFNNLLMVIAGYAGLLQVRLGDEEPERLKEVDAIARAAERAASITGQLLTISRHQVVSAEVVDVDVTLDEMRTVLALAAGATVEVVIDAASGAATMIDPAQLEQVLLNLVINARDAMPDGGRVEVASRREESESPVVVLSVADTGEGMDARQLEHCFDPFFTTKPKTKGTGLGLSTAYGVVTQAGGTIRVDSRKGEGTTFTIELPVVAPAPAVEPTAADVDDGAPLPGSARILLVEDEPDVRALTWDLLELEGYEVVAVPDAETALRMAEGAPPDLLLTDVVMPGMNGVDLAAELSRRHPEVRVLFVSGYPEDAPERRGGRIDAAHLLAKPASAADLRERVRQALEDVPWSQVVG